MFGGQSGGRSDYGSDAGDLSVPRGDLHDVPVKEPAMEMRTILGAGCSLEGKLTCSGPTRIDGDFSGELKTDDVLVIEETATVTADLNVRELVVSGNVRGNINAVTRVSLAPTANIEGDIATPSLMIREGAQIKGKVEVTPARRPALEPVRNYDDQQAIAS
jgi:cytoskeletal protein CcmA (bactofilin family)